MMLRHSIKYFVSNTNKRYTNKYDMENYLNYFNNFIRFGIKLL